MNLKTELFEMDGLFNLISFGILLLCLITSAIMLCLLRCDWGGGSYPAARDRRLHHSLQRPATERPPTWQHAGALRVTAAATTFAGQGGAEVSQYTRG